MILRNLLGLVGAREKRQAGPHELRAPVELVMNCSQGLIAFLLCSVVLLSCGGGSEPPSPDLILSAAAPAEDDRLRQLYEDDVVKMIAVDYGDEAHRSTPGFYVYRKAAETWLRVEGASTRNAVFGRSPTWEETKEAGVNPPMIGWDFRSLAAKSHVGLPLESGGFLFFPDRVEKNAEAGEYVLRFSSRWGIEGVETVLRLPIDELLAGDPELPG